MVDIMHINEEIIEKNSKLIVKSLKENNADIWLIGACRSAITNDPILGATFDSYYGDEYKSKSSDEVNN